MVAVLASVTIVILLIAYFLEVSAVPPEVLIEQGSITGVPQGGAWTITEGGTLRGSFTVDNGTAEVCFAGYDMFEYAVSHGLGFDDCPNNATYSSGFVSSATLSGSLGQGAVYLQTFIPPGWVESQPRPTVTWTESVQVLPN